MKDSFITPGHVRAFQAITSRLYDNITLWSCRINGEPGARSDALGSYPKLVEQAAQGNEGRHLQRARRDRR